MSKEFDTLFYIGRFQPLHNGHLQVLIEAAKRAHKIVVLVGSANMAITPRNPWTYAQREQMIYDATAPLRVKYDVDIDVFPLHDYMYNDNKWLGAAQPFFASEKGRVGLIGYRKDSETASYLNMFQVEGVDATPTWPLDATAVREQYFRPAPFVPTDLLPHSVALYLKDFMKTEQFKYVLDWYEFIRHYDAKKYPITICCVDNVVFQNGHVLLVTRKDMPGRGLLALPGGHVNQGEKFVDAAVRELKEETHIEDAWGEMPGAKLKGFIKNSHFFDNPHRSQHGRVVTMAYYYPLPTQKTLYKVRGDDDAEHARWYKWGTLDPTQFHDDHWHILQEMVRPSEIH